MRGFELWDCEDDPGPCIDGLYRRGSHCEGCIRIIVDTDEEDLTEDDEEEEDEEEEEEEEQNQEIVDV